MPALTMCRPERVRLAGERELQQHGALQLSALANMSSRSTKRKKATYAKLDKLEAEVDELNCNLQKRKADKKRSFAKIQYYYQKA